MQQKDVNYDPTATTRKELTFAACDALAISGKKPSVALVRQQTMVLAGIKKGSDGDVQEDIRLWYEDLFALKRDASIAGIPEPMAALFRETWRGAVELAEEGVSGARAELERDRERAAAEVDRARTVSDALRHELAMAIKEVEARDAAIARLDGIVAQCEAQMVQMNAKVAAKDERIEALSDELARKITEQAAAVTALEGDRRHALLQVDQARGEGRHWKEQFERSDRDARAARLEADAYRNKAAGLETGLAGANGRLEVLQQSFAAERERTAALSSQLAQEQHALRVLSEELSSLRIAVETSNAKLQSGERELSAAKADIAAARVRERKAIDEIDRLRSQIHIKVEPTNGEATSSSSDRLPPAST